MESYGLELVTPPVTEPISVAQARYWLRLPSAGSSNENEAIERAIRKSRGVLEREWSRQLCTATWRLVLPGFPCGIEMGWQMAGMAPIRIPIGPVQSVSSIEYVDGAGNTQTWDSAKYQVDVSRDPATIRPVYGQTYPILRPQVDRAVLVMFVAGYGAAADVPAELQDALFLATAWTFEHRGEEIETAGQAIPEACNRLFRAHWSGRYA